MSTPNTPPQEGFHSRVLERKSLPFAILTTIAILIGGLVEIIPMYSLRADSQLVETAPLTPLEQAGRDLYIREGCVNCHSQMIRPLRAETMRYGEWSRAAEVQHDRPFLLGSRRIGPDLARVGGRYPDAWHYEHMLDPRETSPGSIMPPYPWLYRRSIDTRDVQRTMRTLQRLGTPYSDATVANTAELLQRDGELIAQGLRDAGYDDARWDQEIIALIAYLQRLGNDIDLIIAAEQQ